MNNLKKQEVVWIIWRFAVSFLLGLVMGIIFVNITSSYRSSESDIFGLYLLEQLTNNRNPSRNYFFYLLQYRGKFWLMSVILGMSSYSGWLIIMCMITTGFLAGSLSSSMLVQQGIKVMLFILLANLPQGICYITAGLLLFTIIYQRKGTLFSKDKEIIKTYILTVCWSGMILLAGVLLEAYINPYILKLLTKCLQI